VSIRPGWFWHEKENERVKTARQLMDLYYRSVGRGASFLLNVPPDRRGLLHENDVASLKGFGSMLASTFAVDLAAGAKATASDQRPGCAAARLVDGNRETYWAARDGVKQAEAVLELARPARFDVVRVREAIALGQRVDSIAVDAWQDGGWKQIGAATGVGAARMFKLDAPVTAPKVRLRVTESAVCPAVAEFSLYLEKA
jgi:alpha-L-fucosidase